MRPGPWGVLLGREIRGTRLSRSTRSRAAVEGPRCCPSLERSGQRLCPPLLDGSPDHAPQTEDDQRLEHALRDRATVRHVPAEVGVKSGTRDGELDYPAGVATDGSGNVYVADRTNNRIQKFDADGTFLTAWGTAGSDNGEFDTQTGVSLPDGPLRCAALCPNPSRSRTRRLGSAVPSGRCNLTGGHAVQPGVHITTTRSPPVEVAQTASCT